MAGSSARAERTDCESEGGGRVGSTGCVRNGLCGRSMGKERSMAAARGWVDESRWVGWGLLVKSTWRFCMIFVARPMPFWQSPLRAMYWFGLGG